MRKEDEDSSTSFETISTVDTSSSSVEKRKRGRPRKTALPQPAYDPIYNTPLGYQYMPPRVFPITVGYNNSLYRPPTFKQFTDFNPYKIPSYSGPYIRNLARPPTRPTFQRQKFEEQNISKRKRRSAIIKAKEVVETDIVYEENDYNEEQDGIEKLLDEKDDKFFVKFRNKSYLHCEWISREDVSQTRSGAIKIKRFKPKAVVFDPNYIVIDKILTYESKAFFIKWKDLPIEKSTFELVEDAEKCENFAFALKEYQSKFHFTQMTVSLEWRPPRDKFIKFIDSPEFKNGNKLRSYQLEGLNWLLNRWYYKQSCIMADEMGLGKTVQSVMFVNSLFELYNYTGPVIIVSPLSTLIHWEREFKSWTNLRILNFHASLQGRNIIYENEFYYRPGSEAGSEIDHSRSQGHGRRRLFDVIITTYETVMASLKQLQDIEFSVGIFDEAHRLKNSNSKAFLALKSLNFSHKVLLSGTPLQNNLTELWSLLNFISPAVFNSIQNFLEEFKLEKSEDVERLQSLLRPLMLRRMKEDVEKTIPLKEETIIEVELTMIQKRYYRAILEKNLEFLKKGTSETAPNLLNAMMELRKCCIHPYLIKGAEESIINDFLVQKKKTFSEGDANSEAVISGVKSSAQSIQIIDSCSTPIPIDDYYKILIQSSGKLVLLDKLLIKLQNVHKVLIFSQMTRCLDLLSDYLNYRKFKYERIDGGVKGENRQAAIDRFSSDEGVFVFLLCTRAGGVGINLTAADTVIIFDSDWNPQNDLQAQARCHRIGQTQEVKIYRLVTRNTYEREMFDKAGLKLGLDRAVLQKMSIVDPKIKKKDAIEILLKKGAYGVLMETDDVCKKFCEEDIDQILERRTEIIRHQDGGNVFSKATFQVEEEIDDPDFWDNLLSKKTKEENEGRIKRQIRRVAREANIGTEEAKEIDLLIGEITAKLEGEVLPVEEECNTTVVLSPTENCPVGTVVKISTEHLSKDESKREEKREEKSEKKREEVQSDMRLLVFLISIRKGIKTLNSLKFDCKVILQEVFMHCINTISNKKQKEDMMLNMEFLNKKIKIDSQLFKNDIYERFAVKFLLRIQLPLILQTLLKVCELKREKGYEDDKRLINWVISYGYDNYPTVTGKAKNNDDLNQRIRKIILALKTNLDEIKDTSVDPAIISTILNFGKFTDKNKEAVAKLLNEEQRTKANEMVTHALSKKNRRKRENDTDMIIYKRLNLISKFLNLEEIPAVKRAQGMPRKWSTEDDSSLQEAIESEGISDQVLKKFNLTEEMVIARMEVLVKARLLE